jgi:Tachylectin
VDPVVSLDTPKAALTPGEADEVKVRVLNSGTTVESYRIDVLGPARSWATVPAEPLALFPDASGEAVIKFNPPAEAGPRAGTIRVGVRVAAVSSAGGGTVEEFDLTLAPMVAVTAKLAPPNSRGWRKGRHRVELTNTGNVDTAVFIDARDPDEQLGCRLPQEAIVPAGEVISVPLVVSPLQGSKLIGRPAAYPFEVEIFPSGGQAVALRGSLRQRPLLTPQILVAALVLVALVVGVLALGRSDPKSTAAERTQSSEAVDDSVASSTSSTTIESSTTTSTVFGATTVPGATSTLPAAGGAAPTTVPAVARGASQTGQPATQTPTAEEPAPQIQPQSQEPTPPPPAPAEPAAPVATPAPTTPPPPSTPPMKLGPTYAGDGVLYAVTQSGLLLFYQDQRMDGTSNGVTGEGWAPTGGNQVGCGWGTMQHLIGGENGMLYAVNAAGQLVWYQDLFRDGARNSCAGQGGWNNAGGGDMSPGVNWTGYKQIFYGGNGIIYAVDPSGNLRFCREVGANHQVSAPCPIIGTGWGDLREIFASGAPGVIYAINQNGDFLYFRDLLRNGTNNVNSGWVGPLPIGNGWQQAYKVFGGPINSSVYPNGVVYAIQPNGDLSWYQDVWQNGSNGIGGNQGWYGPSTVGVGWQGFL